MMIDLMSATQLAVFKALKAKVNKAPVFDHVNQDTQPDFVNIGQIETINGGGKHEQLETIEVEVHSIYRGKDRGELLAIMHQVRTIEDLRLEGDGVEFGPTRFIGAAASSAGPDGITYAGISTFEVDVEPA